jgi:beta-glucanase (GH16 family)
MKLILYLSFFFWICSFGLNAQSPPSVDQNWDLVIGKSDEFNGSFDFTKWTKLNSGAPGAAQYFDPNYVYTSNNELIIKTEKVGSNIFTGYISTPGFAYKYGFYEIKAKLPGYYDANGIPSGLGFFPQFWTWYLETANGCITVHDEIDITETSGSQYADGKTFWYGYWNESTCASVKPVNNYIINPAALFADYHTYAVEWLPERIVFYFDDKIIYEGYNDNQVPNHDSQVVIAVGMDINTPPAIATPWPIFTHVDYFRYYQLDYDCGNDATFSNQADLNSFTYSVKRNINFLNGASAITLATGDKKTLRFNEGVVINGDFTVPAGAELTILNTPCN